MRRILLFATICACVLTSRAPADPQKIEAAAPVQSEQSASDVELARAERADLNARMNTVLEAGNKTIAGLQKLIDAAPAGASVPDLEQRMAQAKQDLTLDLLRVQSTFAREKGRMTQADEIDAQIDAILHPRRPADAAAANSSAARAQAVTR